MNGKKKKRMRVDRFKHRLSERKDAGPKSVLRLVDNDLKSRNRERDVPPDQYFVPMVGLPAPSFAYPGSDAKIEMMSNRVMRGDDVFHEGDPSEIPEEADVLNRRNAAGGTLPTNNELE